MRAEISDHSGKGRACAAVVEVFGSELEVEMQHCESTTLQKVKSLCKVGQY